jgi:hypothetical protein
MRRPTLGVRSMVKQKKQYNSVMDELRAESRNPPANDLYIELFRNRNNTEIRMRMLTAFFFRDKCRFPEGRNRHS